MAVLSDAGQLLAAQPTNDSSAVTAPPTPPTAANVVQQTPTPPAPQIQPTSNQPTNGSAQQQDDTHHSLLGRAIKHVISATEGVDYQPDANGNVKPVPAQPGSFFRRLVAGMLVAGAAGAGQKTFTGGFGAGAQAAAQQAQQIDQQKYDRARQSVEDQQKQQQVSDAHTLHQANVAHVNLQMASLLHDMWASDEDRIRKVNESSRVYRQALLDKGGVQSKFRVNGQMVDSLPADQFAKMYTQDPSIAHSADSNSERHFISNTDLSDVHFDGQSWRDDSGNEVSMGPRTTISAVDMPTRTLDSYEPIDGTVLDTIAHGQIVPDPNRKYSINGNGLLALRTLGLKQEAEETRAAAQRTRASKQDQINKQYATIESRKTAGLSRAEHNYWVAVNGGKDPNDALSELNSEKQLIQNGYESEIKSLGGTAQHFDYSGAAAPQAQQPRTNQPRNAPRTFNLSKWKTANPNGDANEAVAEAKRQNLQIVQ